MKRFIFLFPPYSLVMQPANLHASQVILVPEHLDAAGLVFVTSWLLRNVKSQKKGLRMRS